jgi:hypothetical protein
MPGIDWLDTKPIKMIQEKAWMIGSHVLRRKCKNKNLTLSFITFFIYIFFFLIVYSFINHKQVKMATENKKALVFSILDFLQKSCEDGTINKDDAEGIEGIV